MVSSTQQQYLDAMGIDVWRRRGHEIAEQPAEPTAPGKSWQLPPGALSGWLADQHIEHVSHGQKEHTKLLVIGDSTADYGQSASLISGESATLLDAMLKAIDVSRDSIALIELAAAAVNTGGSVADTFGDVPFSAVLFMSALPVDAPIDVYGALEQPGQTCLGAPLIASLHPHYLLANPAAKRIAWEDLKQVRSLLESR